MAFVFSLPVLPPPQAIQTKFTLEVRERFERRTDKDFFEPASDNRSDLFTRIRPTLEVKSGRMSAVLQGQYAHDWYWTPAKTATMENRDAREAFVRYSGPEGILTVGRQKIIAGGERLIGAGEWTNVGRSFDGVRFQTSDWDLFAAKIGVAVPKPRDARVAAAVRAWRAGKTMLVFKGDDVSGGSQEIWTLDHSNRIVRGQLDFDYDVALQSGDNAGKDHEAWAAHFGVGHSPDAANRFYLDLNAASGGPGTSKSETFDNLYPTNHKFYGSMDMQGWRNMRELSLGWQRKLNPKADLHVHGHWFQLMDAKDAWYGAGGAPNKGPNGVFKDPTGAAGREVGFEIDLEGTYRLDPQTTFQAGFAIFEPGKFVERLNGGRADRQTWFFVQVMRRL